VNSLNRQFYTAKEAQDKLGLTKARFHKWVRQGLIPRVILPGMKQGMYPRRDIDALVLSMSTQQEDFVFSASSPADQVEEMNLAYEYFERGAVFSLAERIAFQQKCRFTFHSLKVRSVVVGYISMFRLPERFLDDLLTGRKIEREITVENVLPFVRLEPFSVYIDVIAVNAHLPRHLHRLYAGIMIYRFIDLLYHLLLNDYQITELYTLPGTKDGEKVLKKLGFQYMEGKSLIATRPAYVYPFNAEGIERLKRIEEYYKRHMIASF
jgi:MerR HTH family regulatory protein